MKYRIEENRLVFTIDEDERAVLQHIHDDEPDHFDTDDVMYDWFEPIVCNSDLTWCHPAHTGDLTDAPMLCMLGEQVEGYDQRPIFLPGGMHIDSQGSGYIDGHPIVKRWAFMAYAIATPQRQLLETLECRWEGGDFMEDPPCCECDNTHQANNTVCRWCWSKGRRHWNDPDVADQPLEVTA